MCYFYPMRGANMVNWISKGGCVFMGQKADGVKSD